MDREKGGGSLLPSVLQHMSALALFSSLKTAGKQFSLDKGDGQHELASCLTTFGS